MTTNASRYFGRGLFWFIIM